MGSTRDARLAGIHAAVSAIAASAAYVRFSCSHSRKKITNLSMRTLL